jgi:hypothetical protein
LSFEAGSNIEELIFAHQEKTLKSKIEQEKMPFHPVKPLLLSETLLKQHNWFTTHEVIDNLLWFLTKKTSKDEEWLSLHEDQEIRQLISHKQ